MILSMVFLVLACFFNAVMDAVENENIGESIFKNLPKQFWAKRESWKYTKKVFGYRLDAWHISKSLMIISFVLAAIFFDLPVEKWQDVALYLAVGGLVWNGGFWLFYHVCFKVK